MTTRNRVPTIRLYYQLIVSDSKGKIIRKTRRRLSRSFVIQFLEILHAQCGGIAITITNIAGAEDSWSAGAWLGMAGTAGETEAGILVGSGTTAESNTDFALATQIAHGTSAGQLQYGSTGFTAPTEAAGNVDWVITRAFTNGSGATVTVREIGCAGGEATNTPTTTTGRLLVRDVLPSAVPVANGQVLTVQYTWRTTV